MSGKDKNSGTEHGGMGFEGLGQLQPPPVALPPPDPLRNGSGSAVSTGVQSSPSPPPSRAQQVTPTASGPSRNKSLVGPIFAIIFFIGLIWIAVASNSSQETSVSSADSTPPGVASDNAASAAPNQVAGGNDSPATPNVQSAQTTTSTAPEITMPAVGTDQLLSTAEIRYCLLKKVELDAADGAVNTHVQADVDRFNGMVGDYNSRCGRFKYLENSLQQAQNDIEPLRQAVEAAGRSEFSPSPQPSTGPLLPNPGLDAAGTQVANSALPAQTLTTAPAPNLDSLSNDDLLNRASTAELEKRLYSPAGDNAIEFYLAVRGRNPGDETANRELTDLFPYAAIAVEQNLRKGDELSRVEAARIFRLLERTDINSPMLPRLRSAMGTGALGQNYPSTQPTAGNGNSSTTSDNSSGAPFPVIPGQASSPAQNNSPASANGPSFDCSKATNPTAVAICSDADLSELDRQMAVLYFARYATDPSERVRQRQWIQLRNGLCGTTVECLRSQFNQRIQQLRQANIPAGG